MRRLIPCLVAALTLALATPSSANRVVQVPTPLDAEAFLIERYWQWLKAETGAPADLPWPEITVEPLPPTVRMAFVFPTPEARSQAKRVVLSPRAIDRAAGADRLVVVGELAHELVHYVLVMKENRWRYRAPTFLNRRHHHCDTEFQRLTRGIGTLFWEVYHSMDAVRSVEHMVRQACMRDGHKLAALRGFHGTGAEADHGDRP